LGTGVRTVIDERVVTWCDDRRQYPQ
jgi:hypothetical protein